MTLRDLADGVVQRTYAGECTMLKVHKLYLWFLWSNREVRAQ